MKKLFASLALLVFLATPAFSEDVIGLIYQDTIVPLVGSSAMTPLKNGSATCTQYFGIVALGDCSIKSAMKNGNISSLSHADQHIKNIIGYKKITTKVYGY